MGIALIGLVFFTNQVQHHKTFGQWGPESMASRKWSYLPRVLVTGFLPFHGMSTNPASNVAQRLNGTCTSSVCFEGLPVPVDRAGTKLVAGMLSHGDRWDAVLHLGLEDGAKGLMLETVAMNVKASERAPSSNARLQCGKDLPMVAPSAQCLLATTAPLNRVDTNAISHRIHAPHEAADKRASPREFWSRDAGAYYCNEIYFRTLHAVRQFEIQTKQRGAKKGELMPVLFVHLPNSTEVSVAISAAVVRAIAEAIAGQV